MLQSSQNFLMGNLKQQKVQSTGEQQKQYRRQHSTTSCCLRGPRLLVNAACLLAAHLLAARLLAAAAHLLAAHLLAARLLAAAARRFRLVCAAQRIQKLVRVPRAHQPLAGLSRFRGSRRWSRCRASRRSWRQATLHRGSRRGHAQCRDSPREVMLVAMVTGCHLTSPDRHRGVRRRA